MEYSDEELHRMGWFRLESKEWARKMYKAFDETFPRKQGEYLFEWFRDYEKTNPYPRIKNEI